MKKVGIYSGTFDPVHIGHVSFALEAIELFSLDKIYFLVEPRPRRKQGVKAFEHRVKMVQIAINNKPKLGTIILDQARFTPHETLPVLQSRFKGAELNMLIGDDTLDHIAEWPHVDELLSSVCFIIGARRRNTGEIENIVKNISSLTNKNISHQIFKPESNDVSSSKIKRDLKAHGSSEHLNRNVSSYIERNKLYKPPVET